MTEKGPQERVLDSVCALVEYRVQQALPAEQRGIRARDPIRDLVRPAVEQALEEVVNRIAREAASVIPAVDPHRFETALGSEGP